jgi:predicted dehydrogenase
MRYALIGCSRISKNHFIAAKNNGLGLVGVCDISSDRMKTVLGENGYTENEIPQYLDYLEMLNAEKPDLVSIATGSGSHGKIALDCIEAGVHVILEKPIALSMKEADAIVDAAERKGVKVAMCHQNRFNPSVQALKKAMEAGRFGKVSHGAVAIRWNRGESYYQQALWRGTWAEDGGTLMNQCIHGIDILTWVMGNQIEEIYGITRKRCHPYIEAEDLGLAIIKFKNGAVGTIEGTTNVYPSSLEETLHMFGQTGKVKLSGANMSNIDVWNFADENNDDQKMKGFIGVGSNSQGAGHALTFADMIDAIAKNRKPFVDATDGRNALEVILAIYKSQKTGLPVKLPLKDFGTLDMIGEFVAK